MASMKWLDSADKALTLIFVVLYPLLLILLLFFARELFLPSLIVPALGFVAVSVFRSLYNAPRPYEVTGQAPLLHREGSGKSFPSRHTYSAFIIALCWLRYLPPVGIILLILACGVAFCRVAGGLHFLRDVVGGALVALVFGIVGLWIIY